MQQLPFGMRHASTLFLRTAGFDLFVDADRRRRGLLPLYSLLST